jgi:hypoxanthine phosphoribosyltransferase
MGNEVVIKDKRFVKYISESLIQQRIGELAKEINTAFAGTIPLVIGVLNGSVLFCADLIKQFDITCELSFVKVSSYNGMQSTANVKQLIGLNEFIEGREVIIVEDIVDTGFTLQFLITELQKQNPKRITIVSLLLKPKALKCDVKVDYVGFEIPNDFVVGYGLDYDGLGRNLREIYTLKNEPVG